MGWMWPFSSSNAVDATPTSSNSHEGSLSDRTPDPKKSSYSLTDEQKQRIFGKSGSQQASTSRDAEADAELESFLKSLEAPEAPKTAPTPAVGGIAPPIEQYDEAQSVQDDTGRRILPDGSLDISPEALLPRTMSCRQAFDQAFYCQSLGGKFNDIYRYGHLQSCSENWAAWRFCMRTRTLPSKEREKQIMEYYRDRDAKRKQELGSSEDVWELRDKAVTRAFWRDPDEDEDGHGVTVKE